jgi:glycosyltransferase involved in cell wall biosynthesis
MQIGVITPQIGPRCCVAAEAAYLRRVLEQLRAGQEDDDFVLFCGNDDRNAYPGWVTLPLRASGGLGRLGAVIGQDSLSKAVRKAQIDMIFAPLEHAPLGAPVPMCLYLLDPWPWDPPPGSGVAPESARRAKKACQEAAGIVVPSEHVRRRCLDMFEAPLDKVVVAPPGVDPVFGKPNGSLIPPPYIVAVGPTCPSHNHARVIEACERLAADVAHTLVIAGHACEMEPASWGPQVMRIERLPDAQRAGLYQNAAAVVLPHLHDGAGMELLETLGAGALVVAPKLGAIPELGGNTPVYYNHESTESLRRTLRRVLEDPESTPGDRQRAAKQCREYTWERTAWKVAQVFKKAMV